MDWRHIVGLVFLYGTYRFIVFLVKSYSNSRRPKPCCHGTIGQCPQCIAEAGRLAAEMFANSPEGLKAAELRRMIEIESVYNNIDEETRNQLKASVEERIARLDLLVRRGDIEAAVVRMHERAQNRENKPRSGQV